MYEKRIEYMRRVAESGNLSPLAGKLLTECLDAVEKQMAEIADRTMQQEEALGWLEEKQATIKELRKLQEETIGRLWEKQATITALRQEIGGLLQEQRLVTFAVERYPTMWIGNWPKLKEQVASALKEEEAGIKREELNVREEDIGKGGLI